MSDQDKSDTQAPLQRGDIVRVLPDSSSEEVTMKPSHFLIGRLTMVIEGPDQDGYCQVVGLVPGSTRAFCGASYLEWIDVEALIAAAAETHPEPGPTLVELRTEAIRDAAAALRGPAGLLQGAGSAPAAEDVLRLAAWIVQDDAALTPDGADDVDPMSLIGTVIQARERLSDPDVAPLRLWVHSGGGWWHSGVREFRYSTLTDITLVRAGVPEVTA